MSGGEAVRFFQALGDGTRLELLQQLRREDRTVGELVSALRCPQPKVSRHLKVLKEAGLVSDHRDGRHVTYALTSRRTWPPAAREWLSLLDAGFPPDAATRPARTSASRPAAPAPSRPAAPPPSRSATPSPSRPAAPPQPRPAPASPRPPVRRDMETHLL